jgi:hypothetical protein
MTKSLIPSKFQHMSHPAMQVPDSDGTAFVRRARFSFFSRVPSYSLPVSQDLGVSPGCGPD